MSQKITPEFSFQKPAVYKIRIQGNLNKSWAEKLGGLQIRAERDREQKAVTVLVGQINDQSALSGVLNTLYEHHFTIISVKMLKDMDD